MKDLQCAICEVVDDFHSMHVPRHDYANYWICRKCGDKYEEDLKNFNDKYFCDKNANNIL